MYFMYFVLCIFYRTLRSKSLSVWSKTTLITGNAREAGWAKLFVIRDVFPIHLTLTEAEPIFNFPVIRVVLLNIEPFAETLFGLFERSLHTFSLKS